MRCSESWLREWVNPKITLEELSTTLTMAGLEVEAIVPVKNDVEIEIAITPNRGDCLSVRGIARELAALTGAPLTPPSIPAVPATEAATLPIHVLAASGCPRYVGRVIRDVRADATTPLWMQERLTSGGVKIISPIVDVTNYVMLELGQPMHAFDLGRINQEINVRLAKQGETILLLDGSQQTLDAETLVIADQKTPLAIAGVMGGLDSSVTSNTTEILLESAYFTPSVIARQRQHYGLLSDSAYRFERGVDPTLQQQAIERATQLILEITGGKAGPCIEVANEKALPSVKTIILANAAIQQLLGVSIPREKVAAIFKGLHFALTETADTWTVTVPAYRFDLTIPEDLIEEIARFYGYDNIPTNAMRATLATKHRQAEAPHWQSLRQALSHQGYHEIISYSFVDQSLQTLLNPDEIAEVLVNPITADMGVMRTNLWPGLVNAFLYNQNRQQHRVRLFEVGTVFLQQQQQLKVGGLISGSRFGEQWAVTTQDVDFYDIKATVENILSELKLTEGLEFKPASHPALHPGQTAGVYHQGVKIGMLGALHPGVLQTLGSDKPVYVFELGLTMGRSQVVREDISKFPEIRRDIAILLNQTIPAKQIQDTIKSVAGDWLKDVFIFDVYQGKGVSPGLKSIAVALILQHATRTLVDDEVTSVMNTVIAALKGQLGAELRS